MSSSEQRSGIEIPEGVKPETIMNFLEVGHNYHWTVLTRLPLLVAHGAPALGSGNMPEILLTGNRSMIIAGGDTTYVERIRHMLEMLQRQSQRIIFTKER
jgi:hypothetical protein